MTDSENDSTSETPPATTPDNPSPASESQPDSQSADSPAGGEEESKPSGKGRGRERGKRSEVKSASGQKADADGDDDRDRDSSKGGSSRSGSNAGRSRSRRNPKSAAARTPRESKSPLDADEWQNKAWKLFLSDISEEGTAMFDDQEAKKLAKRSFDLAAIYLRARDQIVGSPSEAKSRKASQPKQDAAADAATESTETAADDA